mmetsp:Transcript_7424/g.21256  ORF Transcript_7424/g.21256 Transcript_7424/m.21256 type:complete len:99 (+) Transcript_7424:1744-2040(+)
MHMYMCVASVLQSSPRASSRQVQVKPYYRRSIAHSLDLCGEVGGVGGSDEPADRSESRSGSKSVLSRWTATRRGPNRHRNRPRQAAKTELRSGRAPMS